MEQITYKNGNRSMVRKNNKIGKIGPYQIIRNNFLSGNTPKILRKVSKNQFWSLTKIGPVCVWFFQSTPKAAPRFAQNRIDAKSSVCHIKCCCRNRWKDITSCATTSLTTSCITAASPTTTATSTMASDFSGGDDKHCKWWKSIAIYTSTTFTRRSTATICYCNSDDATISNNNDNRGGNKFDSVAANCIYWTATSIDGGK